MDKYSNSGAATGREQPSVLVVEADRASNGRIATILREAGVRVTTTPDGGAALAALARRSFDLAIVTTSLVEALGGVELVKAARRRQPGLEILFMAEIATEAGAERPLDARRFLGRVRERLGCGRDPHPDPRHRRDAEFGIAEAKLACLHRRRKAARAAGAGGLEHDLAREIDETIAERQMLSAASTRANRAAARRESAER